MLAGYEHLLRAARRLRWDEAAIDLRPDVRAWAELGEARRAPVRRLVAGFCVAEAAVAAALDPFVAAAGEPLVRDCFVAQKADEERHARFFARAAHLVGARPQDAPPALRDLFERRLSETAAALAGGDIPLGDAVALYHLVLEGVVFAAGQEALMRALEPTALTGTREGVRRVQADERWHVGLGVRCLQDAGVPPPALDALLVDGARAARAWGGEVDDRAVVRTHRRRLGILAGASLDAVSI